MAKTTLEFLLLADDAIIDEKTGKLSIIGVFERISTPNFPAMHPTFKVVSQFSIDDREHVFSLKVVDPEKNKVLTSGGDTTFKREPDASSHRFITSVNNIIFDGPGRYDVVAYIDGKEAARTSLIVEKKEAGNA